MEVIQSILRFLDTQASTPKYFGAFHLIWIAVTIAAAVTLCILYKTGVIKKVNKVILITSLSLLILGLYKQAVLSFTYDPEVMFIYDWNNFPWQFLSVPLVIGLFVGATSGEINKHFLSYLSTFGLIAGLYGMFSPDTFVPTIGLNVYSMLCYGSMIVMAVLILFSQRVGLDMRTFWKSLPVFGMVLGIALTFNELVYLLFPWQNVSLFGVSPHCESSTPVYSLIHNYFLHTGGRMHPLEYLLCLVIYFVFASIVALVPLLIMIGIKKFATTDFDAEYEKNDDFAINLRRSEELDNENNQEIFNFRNKVNTKKNSYMKTYFENLTTNFGNNNQGSCGYVAASMLLSYYDTALTDKIVPRRFDKVTLSHDEPNLEESPGTRFYQPAFDPETVSYKEYIAAVNASKNLYLHECLLSLAVDKRLNDAPEDENSTVFNFGSSSDDIKKVINRYLKKIAEVKKTEYDIHVKDNVDEIKSAKTNKEAKEYSEEIRRYAIRKVRRGYPVLLGIHGKQGGHAVIAYDYDKKADKLYCHFGYLTQNTPEGEKSYTHLTPEECGYTVYKSALVLDFDERKISHTHTDNYEVVIGGALFYYCPDGRYTTPDDLIVEFGKGKKDLSIKGAYAKYRKEQLTIPDTIGNITVTNIDKYAFENQEHITQVVLSCNISSIRKKTFEDCEMLRTVVIPASVKNIGSEAFAECPALKSIMYLGTREQWFDIDKSYNWDRKTGDYTVYCTDGILVKYFAKKKDRTTEDEETEESVIIKKSKKAKKQKEDLPKETV